jgi:2,4-dienoyl-CoA reductase-like NADH-dependent reductase (Old Yellow Enzyme family)/thioredoxin reductase
MLKNIFSPIKIGHIEIPNRLVVPAMVMNFCHVNGTATERYIAYHEAKARGGWGLIITEDYAVDPIGKGFPNIPGLWGDSQTKSHQQFTKRIHTIGSRIFAQIYHAGRQTSHHVIGCQPVAPSPIPCPAMQEMPRELAAQEIEDIMEKFGDCARRAQDAGFDGIEIHGGHGYLIAQFMSPYANKRTDDYGGNLENRMRFPLEIIRNIRKKVGEDFPVIFRISGDELVLGGRTMEETKAIAVLLEKAGVHALHVSAGVYESSYGIVPPAAIRHGWITGFAEMVKHVVDIPVITVGRITDPLHAEAILAEGKADLVAMGRASLADPDLPRKAAAGQFAYINHCIGCLQGCNGRIALYQPATCMVNPTLGKEDELIITPARVKKKIFIAGAGPAGMEAAIIAARRGHDVHIFEKTRRLGGQFYTASIPPDKSEINDFIIWQKKQLDDLGVSIHLNQELREETVKENKPDVVIVATGSIPMVLAVPGSKGPHVVTAHDVLNAKVSVGQSVVVIGGGMIGSETASYLANQGKTVTIVEILPKVAADAVPAVRYFLLKNLKEKKVCIHVNATVREILDKGLILEKDGHLTKLEPFDSIVLAAGVTSCNELSTKLQNLIPQLITIGDALKVRKALDAIAEGYMVGLDV